MKTYKVTMSISTTRPSAFLSTIVVEAVSELHACAIAKCSNVFPGRVLVTRAVEL